MDHLGNAQVEQTFELSRTVNNETTRWIELIRFRELEQGILYARFEPKCRVLSCVAPHFAERLSVENWWIHDAVHEEYAVHGGWQTVDIGIQVSMWMKTGSAHTQRRKRRSVIDERIYRGDRD